jgi:serine/threonine protein kinase
LEDISDDKKLILFNFNTNNLTKYVGTELYSSPEQLNGKEYTSKTDIYSLGIMMIDIFFEYNTQMERNVIIRDIKNNKLDNIPLVLLIKSMIDKNPNNRPDIDNIYCSIEDIILI